MLKHVFIEILLRLWMSKARVLSQPAVYGLGPGHLQKMNLPLGFGAEGHGEEVMPRDVIEKKNSDLTL